MLKYPPEKLAEKILAEVSFENRFVAYKLRRRMGAVETTLYGFEAVAAFLLSGSAVVDYDEIERWIKNIYGDEELATKIGELKKQELSDAEKTKRIGVLMSVRFYQCLK